MEQSQYTFQTVVDKTVTVPTQYLREAKLIIDLSKQGLASVGSVMDKLTCLKDNGILSAATDLSEAPSDTREQDIYQELFIAGVLRYRIEHPTELAEEHLEFGALRDQLFDLEKEIHMNSYYKEEEIKGPIDYDKLIWWIRNQGDDGREFLVRRTPDEKYMFRLGNKRGVPRGEGANYLHLHTPHACPNTHVGLPSPEDIDGMIIDREPHMVISKLGMATYRLLTQEQYDAIDKYHWIEDNPTWESERVTYACLRSVLGERYQEKDTLLAGKVLINFFDWKKASFALKQHDFRQVPEVELADNACIWTAPALMDKMFS